MIQVVAAPCLEHDAWVVVLGCQFDPAFSPRSEGEHDVVEVAAGLGECVALAASDRTVCDLDDAGLL